MSIYLIDRETNEIINTYTNIVSWAENFVECKNNNLRSKIYCDTQTEYFTDIEPIVETDESTLPQDDETIE